MSDLHTAVRGASARLEAAGIRSPETDAVELAAFALGTTAGDVRRAMVLRTTPDAGFAAAFEALVSERLTRVPLQHLMGRAHFRGLTLAVGPGVLPGAPAR